MASLHRPRRAGGRSWAIGPRLANVLLLLLALLPLHVTAAPNTVFLEQLTSPEVGEAIRGGKTTIIVPIGGTEQNGPHMALGKHNVRVRALSEKIALLLGNALVAPVVAYVPEGSVDPPAGHMRFAGTISIPPATFISVLEGAARSFRSHGFRDVVFLGDHGGYQREERIAADRLNREWKKTPARAHAVEEYYRVVDTAFRQTLRDRGFRDPEIGSHAGLADTSLALAIDPRLVRLDRLAQAASSGAAGGVQGDPRRASAELGQIGVDAIVAQTADAIRRAVRR